MDLMLKKCEISAFSSVSVLTSAGLLVGRCNKSLSDKKVLVCTDSRKASRGAIFIAIKGSQHDGHQHLDSLTNSGLSLIVTDQVPPDNSSWSKTTPWVQVTDSRKAWSFLAAASFNCPQNHLKLLAVTGTNGKTSTVWMIGELLRSAGVKCMTIGTLGAYVDDLHIPTGHTTPDPDLLFSLLRFAVDRGVSAVAMEASSHALAQSKLAPLAFDAAAFTSFSRDHLDFHETLEDYWSTKWRLFADLSKPGSLCLFSLDLGPIAKLASLTDHSRVLYGEESPASANPNLAQAGVDAAFYRVFSSDFRGSQIRLERGGREIASGFIPYFATHALDNFFAAMLLASHAYGAVIPSSNWGSLRPVPGRLEQVIVDGQAPVIVDYAHTPDALEKTLQVLRPLCQGKLKLVFGCGGNRDKGKRPLMGAIAANLADHVIVTSDNPRREDPREIINDICRGMQGQATFEIEIDRELAIRKAVAGASRHDLILIAGKGHETEQIFAETTVPFDDRSVARRALFERGK
ncbi:MAG: hypothetical protein RL011_2268 [Pseudomonadota bacterium]